MAVLMKQLEPRSLRPWQLGAALFAVFVLAVACATFVPQHGWSPDSGPVVPHDTFPADCSLCHVGGDWHSLRQDFAFDHQLRTGYALQGAHATAGCLMCHNDRGPVAQFAAQGCAGCHADPHLGRLGANCKDCHEERTWYPREAIAQHDRTRFPLVGAHAAAACYRCHPGAQVGNFAGASSECFHCHAADYQRPQDPNHVLLNFSRDCQTCHLPLGWQPSRFDHPASFPLTQGHGGRLCRECHTTPNTFTGLSTDCASCHTPDFMATSEPSHPAAGFANDCSQCHDTRTFQRANWPHPGSFALTLGHAGRRCTECHVGQSYMNTQTDCASCHLDTYQATQQPNHATAGFGTDCAGCHNTVRWQGGSFTHPASFPLTNSHNTSCTACHTTPGSYTGLSTACASCHLTDYNATTNPNHAASMFSTDCTGCHGTATWQGASVAHPATFPLTNAHNRACTSCHTTPGTYAGLSTQCASCHISDYNATNNPPHLSFQMSQQCQDCHGTTNWGAGNWNHAFPIHSGAHNNMACFDCHNNPANRVQFSCIDCHEHRQSSMNSKHSGVSGYVWASANCYQCHPQGRH